MSDKLKKIFEEGYVDAFNEKQPMKGHRDRFEARLELRNPRKPKQFKILRWAYLSAAMVVGIIVTVVIQQIGKENDRAKQLSLSDVSFEMASMEKYFSGEIASRLAVVDREAPEVQRYLEDLQKLEKDYEQLIYVLNNNVNNDKVIAAMIQNYKLRLQILEHLRRHLDLKNNPKNLSYEKEA